MKRLWITSTAAADRHAGKGRRREAGEGAPEDRDNRVTRLSEERAQRKVAQLRNFMRMARALDLDDGTLRLLNERAKVYVAGDKNWVFVMLVANFNREVVRYINAHCLRPRQAAELWAELLTRLRFSDCTVDASRADLSQATGIPLTSVSQIMGELQAINAVRVEKVAGRVRYSVSPWIVSRQSSSAARAAARKEWGPLRIVTGVAAE